MRYLPTKVYYDSFHEIWKRCYIPENEVASIHVSLNSDKKGLIEVETKSDSEWFPTIAELDGTKDWTQVLAESWIEL